MRFLLDQGVARSVAVTLREAGHDAVHVGECGQANSEDAAILAHAREQDRIVVTFDADFAAIMALSGDTKPSIIHIRIEGLAATAQSALVAQLAREYGHDLSGGAILSVHRHAVRRKSLPIE